MPYIIAGLGNPGEEYAGSRHNTGRIMLEHFREANGFEDWEANKKLRALVSEGKVGKEKVTLIEPETFMNKSGQSLAPLITSAKKAENLIVIYDDLDLAFGTFKISFNRGAGGHHGLESVMKAVKTKAFARVRVGIAPATSSGKIKKPQGEDAVGDFILGKFKPAEQDILKKVQKKVSEALTMLVTEGREKAMGEFN